MSAQTPNYTLIVLCKQKTVFAYFLLGRKYSDFSEEMDAASCSCLGCPGEESKERKNKKISGEGGGEEEEKLAEALIPSNLKLELRLKGMDAQVTGEAWRVCSFTAV